MTQLIGTPSLKSLAFKYLAEQKQVPREVQAQVQAQVQPSQKCTYPTDEITPEEIAYAQKMLVDCFITGGKIHCWYCAACPDSETCRAWHPRRADVELFRKSDKPASLLLMEEQYAAGGVSVPDYAAFCPEYWKGCFSCPDFRADSLRFCGRYNLLHGEAAEVVQ